MCRRADGGGSRCCAPSLLAKEVSTARSSPRSSSRCSSASALSGVLRWGTGRRSSPSSAGSEVAWHSASKWVCREMRV
eukprot:3465193-Prymnesium_polylepis.1